MLDGYYEIHRIIIIIIIIIIILVFIWFHFYNLDLVLCGAHNQLILTMAGSP